MSKSDAIRARLETLSGLQARELRTEWHRCFNVPAPRHISKDLLLRAVAFHVQAQLLGDGGRVLERRIGELRQKLEDGVEPAASASAALAPGSRLVREWGGQQHVVTVDRQGQLEYRGDTFRSLTDIARRITGAHWSGPRFFGTRARRGAPSYVESETNHG